MALIDFQIIEGLKPSKGDHFQMYGSAENYILQAPSVALFTLAFTAEMAPLDELAVELLINGAGVSFVMIADGPADGSGNSFPAGWGTLSEWVEYGILPALQGHPLLAPYFTIYLDGFGIALEASEARATGLAISSANASGTFSFIGADGAPAEYNPGHKMKATIYLDGPHTDTAPTGVWRPVGVEWLSPGPGGDFSGFDPGAYARAALQNKRRALGGGFPYSFSGVEHDYAATCRMRVGIQDVYGDPQAESALTFSAALDVFHGGLRGVDMGIGIFFIMGTLALEKSFLTWRPTTRTTYKEKPEFLSSMLWADLPTGESWGMEFTCKYSTGVDIVHSVASTTQTKRFIISHWAVGYTENNLGALDPSRTMLSYEARLISPSAGLLAGPVTFNIDPAPRLAVVILFRNSLGGVEVEAATGLTKMSLAVDGLLANVSTSLGARGATLERGVVEVYEISMGAKDLATHNALQDLFFQESFQIQDASGFRFDFHLLPATYEWREVDVDVHVLTFKARPAYRSAGASKFFSPL
jgi:hypothetical protein